MKTQNNITRRISQSVVIVLVTVLFVSSNLFAGEFPLFKLKTDVSVEKELKIEKWMLNLANWKTSNSSLMEVTDFESEMVIENWMLKADDANWDYTDYEGEVELEDWMLDASEENWSSETLEEEEIELEDWMTDLNTWK